MKRKFYTAITCSLFGLWMSLLRPAPVTAQQNPASKTYQVKPGQDIVINNTSRNILLQTWKEPTVKIEVENAAGKNMDSLLRNNGININSEGKNFTISIAEGHRFNYTYSTTFKLDTTYKKNFSWNKDSVREIVVRGIRIERDSIRNNINATRLRSDSIRTATLALVRQKDSLGRKVIAPSNNKNRWSINKLGTLDTLRFNDSLTSLVATSELNNLMNFAQKISINTDSLHVSDVNINYTIPSPAINDLRYAASGTRINTDSAGHHTIIVQGYSHPRPATTVITTTKDGVTTTTTASAFDHTERGSNNIGWVTTPDKKNQDKIYIFIPVSAALKINNSFGNVNILNDIDSAVINNANGNIQMQNAKRIKLNSSFGKVSGENIEQGKISINNGRASFNNSKELKIGSSFSDINLNHVLVLKLSSSNDEYNIEQAGDINASKSFGSLRIGKLDNILKMSGSNADLKILELGSKLQSITIDNSFADIKIPVKKAQQVAVNGSFNTIYNDDMSLSSDKIIHAGNADNASKPIKIQCNNCTLDFK